ncbi:MAG TPA: tetratricopeptide repeat protein [Thermoanaerobaculia bacterium]
MRKFFQWALFLVIAATCVPSYAATPTDFYVELLRRGVAEVEAGRHANAVTPLRLAAFGLLESIEQYETAQAYLVVSLDRMNQTDAAREAALRIVAAEKVERRFASLALPAEIRTAFTASARKLLPASDVTALTAPAPSNQATTQVRATPPAQTSSKPVVESTSRPVVESPSRPVVEKPAPAQTTPAQTAPAQTQTQPAPAPSTTRRPDDSKTPPQPPARTPPAPTPAAPRPQPVKPAIDVPARIAAGERALTAANLAEGRRIYRELLDAGGHDHATWIRVAEGLYRSRDFAGALNAFQHVGALRAGEEAYRYYIAVAYYESGQYDRARRELTAALPFIELTPDVQRYRSKIEAAR